MRCTTDRNKDGAFLPPKLSQKNKTIPPRATAVHPLHSSNGLPMILVRRLGWRPTHCRDEAMANTGNETHNQPMTMCDSLSAR
jgi:hypothetical protein